MSISSDFEWSNNVFSPMLTDGVSKIDFSNLVSWEVNPKLFELLKA